MSAAVSVTRGASRGEGAAVPTRRARVLVTRPTGRADDVSGLLSAAGFEPVCVPTISVAPAADLTRLDAALHDLATYDVAVFASDTAARLVARRAAALGIPADAWAGVAIVAGPAPAATLAAHGVGGGAEPGDAARAERLTGVEGGEQRGRTASTLIVSPFSAEAALAALAPTPLDGRRVLLPRAAQGRDALPDGLAARGAIVEAIAVYRTVPVEESPDLIYALRHDPPVAATFFSPSAVAGFANALRAAGLRPSDLPAPLAVVCIGETTAAAARDAGLSAPIVAPGTTARAVVDSLIAHAGATDRTPAR